MNFLIYIILGLIGGSGHYLKKRYVDDTTKNTFSEYLKSNPQHTKRSIVAIISAAIGLSLNHDPSLIFTSADIVAAIATGYTSDSILNKAGNAND